MRARRGLLGFGAALLVVFGGVAWISVVALRLDGAELAARRQTAVDDDLRLALWRMDSALLPLIARESARAPSEYQTAFEHAEHVKQLFELGPDGAIGGMNARDILAAMPATPMSAGPGESGFAEWQLRSASVDGCAEAVGSNGAMTAVWLGGELLLVRRVGDASVQGAWLDWPEIQRWLPQTVADLLPAARVEPAGLQDGVKGRLAALPLRLLPGPIAFDPASQRSSVRLVLTVAWAGLLLAAAAVIALMAGTISLSERRATFVSAVTHELRTPLTTLQTYSEMLVDGKMTDPDKRQRYLETLHGEALRLGHLVENVLAYSGLEGGRRAVVTETLSVATLLERCRERLAARVAQAGMTLELDADESLAVRGDRGPIEQILFNLVDNACKYGAGKVTISSLAHGATIELRVRDAGAGVPPDVRGRLFEPFSKSAERAAGGAPGVGLGLALSRSLARAMGGELRLEPGAGGACFVLAMRCA